MTPPADLIPFDQNGHLISRWPSPHQLAGNITELRTLTERMPAFPLRWHLQLHEACTWCGQRPTLALDGDTVRIPEPCPAVNGCPIEYEINFPSGRIIVANDLRPTYSVDQSDLPDYNTEFGQAAYVMAMAQTGCAFGPVGNTSPGLYSTGGDSYVIAADHSDNHTLGIPRALIVTDLWAYCIADAADWKARGSESSGLKTIVRITPGTYRFRHHTGERNFDEDAEVVVFAHIERVG
jgi:hypothetical protein